MGGNLGPKIDENERKFDAQMPSYVEVGFWIIFHRFLDSSCIPRRPIGASGLNYFCFLWFSCCLDLGYVFGVNLASFFLQKSIKIEQNTDSKRHSKFVSSWTSFLIEFSSFWLHVGPQVGAKLGPFGPQDAPKIQPKSVRNRSWEPKASKIGFWSIFDRCLIDCRWILDRFLVDFWSIFDWFVDRFLNELWSIFRWIFIGKYPPRCRAARPAIVLFDLKTRSENGEQ